MSFFGGDLDNDLDAMDIDVDFAYWETGLFLADGAAFFYWVAKLIAELVLALTGIFGIGLLALRLESGFLPSSPVFLEV
jgi:hypothetical protein